ncbi:hypothetical protein [Fusobacterium polymorphum]|uniref:hypothetical protein n=1 Tax=Fusobacterium nucleatum subsp. polymorphum TaxID=76857 RepID=UPI0030082CDF
MKIIKKGLLFVLMIFAFTSCSLLFPESEPEVSTVNSVASFTRAQKSIAIVNGTDYIRRKVADQLSNRGWKVSGAMTGKETFAIYFDQLDERTTTTKSRTEYYDGYGGYKGSGPTSTSITKENFGYVSVYDLRTNKRLYVYDITGDSEDRIIKGIITAIDKLEENMR